MEEGFSLDSVHIEDRGIPIDQTVEFSAPILTNPAKTPFPNGNMTPPWTKFTLDLSSAQGREVGGEFRLDEAPLGHLCPRSSWETEQVGSAKSRKTLPAELQELTLRNLGLGDAPMALAGIHGP